MAAEYFLGNDPGQGAGIPLYPEDGIFDLDIEGTHEVSLDTSGWTIGIHRVGLRFMDDSNEWGSVRWLEIEILQQHLIPEPMTNASNAVSQVVTAEYFWNDDPGPGSGTPLNPADGTFDSDLESIMEMDLNVSGLSAGNHKVGIRFKDSMNQWSTVRWLEVEVLEQNLIPEPMTNATNAVSKVVTAEYFWNHDPGPGSGIPLDPADGAFDSDLESILEMDLNVSGLSADNHKVGIRFQDSMNQWSTVRWLEVEILEQNLTPEAQPTSRNTLSQLSAAEYFLNDEPEPGSGIPLSPADGAFDSDLESNLEMDLQLSDLSSGDHRIGVRYQDESGTWSAVSWLELTVNAPAGPTSEGLNSLSQLVAAEYFLNLDPGQGMGIALNAEDGAFNTDIEGNLELNLDTTGFPAGDHQLGLRYKDKAGNWSDVSWLFVEVNDADLSPESSPSHSSSMASLVSAEYFVDLDPGEGAGIALDAEDGFFNSEIESILELNLNVEGMSAGEHSLGIRYLDQTGNWSPSRRLHFTMVDEPFDLAPTDIHLSDSTVDENQAIGTRVGSFTATDPDSNATHSFSLVPGSGSIDNALFTIDGDGVLRTTAILDYETNPTRSIRVQAKNHLNAVFHKIFIIQVMDLPDNHVPVITSYEGNVSVELDVSEGQSFAAEVNATDADGNALIYSLDDGDDLAKFEINESSGVILFIESTSFRNPGDQDNDNTYVVTAKVTDGIYSAFQEFKITVRDYSAPVITLVGEADITHEAGVAFVDPGAVWADGPDANGTLLGQGILESDTPGIYSLTYDVEDEAGNQANTILRTITVQDTTAPLLSLIGETLVTVEVGEAYQDQGALWTDFIDGNGTLYAVESVNENLPGVYRLNYQKMDASGNLSTTLTRTVTVMDRTPPSLFLVGDANVTMEAGEAYSDPGALWTDVVDGNGTLFALESVNENVPGVYRLNYDKTDSAGNLATTLIRTVTVRDGTPPSLLLVGNANQTMEAGESYVDQGAVWTDIVDGNGTVFALESVKEKVPGVYLLNYDKMDLAGNLATSLTRTVTVRDSTAPTLFLIGDTNVTHEAGQLYTDKGAFWWDLVDGNGTVFSTEEVNENALGTYLLTYFHSDSSSNKSIELARSVKVTDSIAPEIILNGHPYITIWAGSEYVDKGAWWIDTFDGNGTIQAIGTVNSHQPGSYTLHYEYTDLAGNQAIPLQRIVSVVDVTEPILTLIGDANLQHEVGSPYFDQGAKWSDAQDGNGSVNAVGLVNFEKPGIYSLTYDFTDSAGNKAKTIRRIVTVIDSVPPEIILIGSSNVTHPKGEPYEDLGAYWTDNFDGNGTVQTIGFVNANKAGVYLLSYKFSDKAGNQANPVHRFVKVSEFAKSGRDFNLSNVILSKNKEIGGTVGNFESNGSSSSSASNFYLVDGQGGQHNHFFTIENKNSLSLSKSLQDEHQSTLSIRVKTIFNDYVSMEKVFSLKVENAANHLNNGTWDDLLQPMALGENWFFNHWFGNFWDSGSGWIFHSEHRWIYPFSRNGNYWLYLEHLGWLWTNSTYYGPSRDQSFLYSENFQSWIFYERTTGLYFIYARSIWLNLFGEEM